MRSTQVAGLALVSSIIWGTALTVLPQSVDAASYQRAPEAKVFSNSDGAWQQSKAFFAYDQAFLGGGHVALTDLGKDGVAEIVTTPGLGGGPFVRTFRLDGSFIHQFLAYDEQLRSGINVAAGDIDGKGRAEIVTAPKEGAGPYVRVFDANGRVKGTVGWFAYPEAFHGGVNVAVGDVDADGKAEIITGNGAGMRSTVKVFTAMGKQLGDDYLPFDEASQGGVSVAVGNVDNDAAAEIITAVQSNGQAWVKIYNYDTQRTIVKEFKTITDDFTGGINVAVASKQIVVAVHGKGGPQVQVYDANGNVVSPGFMAYEEDFRSGVNVAAYGDYIVTMPNKLKPEWHPEAARSVRVDLSEQRLYAYENGYLVNSFLISSGLPKTPSPPGEYHIQRKIYSHLYSGPDYFLPNTLYNLQFRSHYYLHGAYWHNNFGHPMSHGCINIHYKDAKWIYDWMQVGDLTVIEY